VTDEPRSEPGHGTPEGYTPEEPAPEELGQRGTPGAGLTPESPHAADAEAIEQGEPPPHHADEASAANLADHDSATHMDAHNAPSDDDHGHAEPTLGPIDWAVWSYALIGAAAALIMVAAFWVAIA
jgi:hypothetical protein